MSLKIAIGADHGGFELKNTLVIKLSHEYEIIDVGADKFDSADDYPDFSFSVAQLVSSGKVNRGIIICGSGVGACIVSNKVPGIRASVCHDTYSAHQGVEHDDMNILCLGARVIGIELAFEIVNVFLNAKFSGEERHHRRLDKAIAIEKKFLKT